MLSGYSFLSIESVDEPLSNCSRIELSKSSFSEAFATSRSFDSSCATVCSVRVWSVTRRKILAAIEMIAVTKSTIVNGDIETLLFFFCPFFPVFRISSLKLLFNEISSVFLCIYIPPYVNDVSAKRCFDPYVCN